MPFTHRGDVTIVAHPEFPNLYGAGNLNVEETLTVTTVATGTLSVSGNQTIAGDLVVAGTVSASSIGVIDQSVSAIKASDQTIATGVETNLTNWSTADAFRYNTGGCFNETTGTWTCLLTPGKYEFNLHCIWDNTSSTAGVRQIRALLNGVTEVTLDRIQPFPDSSIFVTQRIHCDVYMTVGQYIIFKCLQDSGTSVDVDSRSTITVKRI
jgi:hypothetical protein